jgi:hypothetical protein
MQFFATLAFIMTSERNSDELTLLLLELAMTLNRSMSSCIGLPLLATTQCSSQGRVLCLMF